MSSMLADPANPLAAPRGGAPAIDAVNVVKRFEGTVALKDVSLRIEAGQVHALVGENGAGKSTFLGIIAGRISPTSGQISIFGQEHVFGTPRAARRLGIAAIYQELTIVPALGARANVFLGQPFSNAGFLSERRMQARYLELCNQFGVTIPGDVPASQLSVADQQTLEIMRGIQSDARILLFDEPTTALAPPERDALFRQMRRLRDEGKTMILVSHNLEEVLDISDRVTVFRDGMAVASAPRQEWTKASLVRAMIGHDLAEAVERPLRSRQTGRAATLSVRGVRLTGAIEGIGFDVEPGEIVGIGGLVGSGRSSLLRCIAGLEPQSEGTLTMNGMPVDWPRTPRQALAAGIALVPEDRKHQGLVLGMSAAENIAMTKFSKVSRLGMLLARDMREKAVAASSHFGFAESRLSAAVRNLSGGNQQKILLSKWYYDRPKVLLVDEPTRGIDIGAKEEIRRTLLRLADEGMSIIMVSSELEEVVDVSDRVVVLSEGRQVALLDRTDGPIRVDDILIAAFGVGA